MDEKKMLDLLRKQAEEIDPPESLSPDAIEQMLAKQKKEIKEAEPKEKEKEKEKEGQPAPPAVQISASDSLSDRQLLQRLRNVPSAARSRARQKPSARAGERPATAPRP